MAGASEVGEEIEHAGKENKSIALLIAVLALFLAFAGAGGKGAQTEASTENVEVANLWAFYQAKAIRGTTLSAFAELLESEIGSETNPAVKAAKEQQIKAWKQTIARYESEQKHVKAARNSRSEPSWLRNIVKHRWGNTITTKLRPPHWRSALCLRRLPS